ncbi:Yip1 family protein [Streptomyces boninensis]|uniref:Yip1 family protein n=1 Tax=Streptomyces boninensis TaxID=2039455 RepID=UPI003B21E898
MSTGAAHGEGAGERPEGLGLTAAELGLWQAYRTGSWFDMRERDPGRDDPAGPQAWGPERTVRAAVIALLLLDGPAAAPGRVAALKLNGARVTGGLDLSGGDVRRYLELRNCRFEGEVLLPECRVTTARFIACAIPRFEGARLQVEGDLYLSRCTVDDGVRLTDARIGADLQISQLAVGADRRGRAIAADGIMVGHEVTAELLQSNGQVSLRGAVIGDSLNLAGSVIRNPYDRWALNAPQLTVFRSFTLTPTTGPGSGHTRSRDTGGGNFECHGGLRLDDGLFVEGVDFTGARFVMDEDQEIALRRIQTPELRFTGKRPERGRVVLSGAKVGGLTDTYASWPPPGRLQLEGFTYEYLIPADRFPIAERLEWVDATDEYSPQPYEQLAATLHRSGDHRAARQVQRAQQRRLRADLPRPRRAWEALRDTPGIQVVLWAGIVMVLLVVAWSSTRAVLADTGNGAGLAPSDAPPVLVAIVSVITASGVLVGGILNGLAKFVRARGQNTSDLVQARGHADASLIQAQAEMRRAEADFLRARKGLPPAEPPDLSER